MAAESQLGVRRVLLKNPSEGMFQNRASSLGPPGPRVTLGTLQRLKLPQKNASPVALWPPDAAAGRSASRGRAQAPGRRWPPSPWPKGAASGGASEELGRPLPSRAFEAN